MFQLNAVRCCSEKYLPIFCSNLEALVVWRYPLLKNSQLVSENNSTQFRNLIRMKIYYGEWSWNVIINEHTCKEFLGVFAKLRKATVSFVTSVWPCVCLSVFMEQLVSHWADFHEIWHLSIFRKSIWKIQVSPKSHYGKTYVHAWLYLTQFFLEWEMFRTNCVDKLKKKKHYTFNKFFQEILPFVK